MDFDINKLIGSKLKSDSLEQEDKDYITADKIGQWRHECKQKSTYLQHGNLLDIIVASVPGEPNVLFTPEKENLIIAISSHPLVGLIPEFPDTLNYSYYVMWPELRPFDHTVAMKCVHECARNMAWAEHPSFAIVLDQNVKPEHAAPPGMVLYRGMIMVQCAEHAKMVADLSRTMLRAWDKLQQLKRLKDQGE